MQPFMILQPNPTCMQNCIEVFHTVQEASLICFRSLTSVKPPPKRHAISQVLGLELVNINAYAIYFQNIPHGWRDRANFTFSEFWPRMTLHLTIPSSTSCQYQNVWKFYQNIPYGSRIMVNFNTLTDYGRTHNTERHTNWPRTDN